MKTFKKGILFVLALALALSDCGCAFGGGKRLGKDAALQIALEHAELSAADVSDVDVELERSIVGVWYEVNFDSGWKEYEYRIDAESGEILSAGRD